MTTGDAWLRERSALARARCANIATIATPDTPLEFASSLTSDFSSATRTTS
jgi:hypothetical protein